MPGDFACCLASQVPNALALANPRMGSSSFGVLAMAHGSVVEMSRFARLPSLLFLLVLALASMACFPHYQVISHSGPPSALVGLGEVWVQYDYAFVAISDKRMSEE